MGKEVFFQKISNVFGVDYVEKVVRYCQENCQEDVTHVMRVADDACENRFLFDFPWDMERTYEPVTFTEEIDWSLIPFGDREFLWQFNRHRFLLCLGQAYLLTGEEKYARHYVRLMKDWIERAQEGDNIDLGPWRTLETGLRVEIWLRSLCMIEKSDAADEAFICLVEECLRKHGRRLRDHFSAHKYISNWGVLESSGLLLLSIAADVSDEERQSYRETALTRLVHAAKIQVLEDGTQWEQSPMYHNEVYQCFRSALYYGERAGIDMPEEVRSAVWRMAYVDGIWKKPDHTQFTQGDSDASDLRDQITAGACVFMDPVLKYWGYDKLDYENVWQFGYTACEKYNALEAKEPDFVSAELPFSGNYYFRDSWKENGNVLHFHCGDTGGGHGHADKLHVDLVLGGEDVLVDGGRYTYVDGADRYALKEPEAHNVVLVDGCRFSECETSWIYKNICSCLKQQYHEGKTGAFVEGSHLGYMDKGILVNRQVIWIKPDIYVLVDHFYGTGKHTYETLFHFDRRGTVSGEDGLVHFTGRQAEGWLQTVSGAGTGRLYTTKQSLHYNEVGENQTYAEKNEAEGNFHKITVINGGQKGKTAPMTVDKIPVYSIVHQKNMGEQDAEALRITSGDREYVLLLCHQEIVKPTDIMKCENCLGYGKAVLFDRSKEKQAVLSGEILAWW